MSLAHYVLDYVNDLKWPALALILSVVFQSPIKRILGRVADSDEGGFSFAGVGLSWKKALGEVNSATQGARDGTSAAVTTSDLPIWQTIFEVAQAAPQATVLLAFSQVEVAVRQAAEGQGIERSDRLSLVQLRKAMELPRGLSNAVRKISGLRNDVAHRGAEPTPEEAKEYARSAQGLTEKISTYATAQIKRSTASR